MPELTRASLGRDAGGVGDVPGAEMEAGLRLAQTGLLYGGQCQLEGFLYIRPTFTGGTLTAFLNAFGNVGLWSLRANDGVPSGGTGTLRQTFALGINGNFTADLENSLYDGQWHHIGVRYVGDPLLPNSIFEFFCGRLNIDYDGNVVDGGIGPPIFPLAPHYVTRVINIPTISFEIAFFELAGVRGWGLVPGVAFEDASIGGTYSFGVPQTFMLNGLVAELRLWAEGLQGTRSIQQWDQQKDSFVNALAPDGPGVIGNLSNLCSCLRLNEAVPTDVTDFADVGDPNFSIPSTDLNGAPWEDVSTPGDPAGGGGVPTHPFAELQKVTLFGGSFGFARAQGALTVERFLSGSSQGIAQGEATISTTLQGSSQGVAQAQGAITISLNLAGASQGIAQAQGDLMIGMDIAGSSQGVAQAQGALTIERFLQGASQGSGNAEGEILIPGQITGSSQGIAQAQGNLSMTRTLAGSSQGIGDAQGDLTFVQLLVGSSQGVGNAQADLTKIALLSGAAQGVADAIGAIVRETFLAGDSQGSAQAQGTLELSLLLHGSSQGVGNAQGNLVVIEPGQPGDVFYTPQAEDTQLLPRRGLATGSQNRTLYGGYRMTGLEGPDSVVNMTTLFAGYQLVSLAFSFDQIVVGPDGRMDIGTEDDPDAFGTDVPVNVAGAYLVNSTGPGGRVVLDANRSIQITLKGNFTPVIGSTITVHGNAIQASVRIGSD